MTQPSAVAIVQAFAYQVNALKVFDAGDVQANGFQLNADATPFETVTEFPALPTWALPPVPYWRPRPPTRPAP